jgi:hypothetical protein
VVRIQPDDGTPIDLDQILLLVARTGMISGQSLRGGDHLQQLEAMANCWDSDHISLVLHRPTIVCSANNNRFRDRIAAVHLSFGKSLAPDSAATNDSLTPTPPNAMRGSNDG